MILALFYAMLAAARIWLEKVAKNPLMPARVKEKYGRMSDRKYAWFIRFDYTDETGATREGEEKFIGKKLFKRYEPGQHVQVIRFSSKPGGKPIFKDNFDLIVRYVRSMQKYFPLFAAIVYGSILLWPFLHAEIMRRIAL